MNKLDELIGKVEDISLGGRGDGDMFPYLREFFSSKNVQERLVELNQRMLFDLRKGVNGARLGAYSPVVAGVKSRQGLPSDYYTFYETGSFYRSMGVLPEEEEVVITSSDNGLGLDTIGRAARPRGIEMSHIGYMKSKYDPQGMSLGLSEDILGIFVEDETIGIKGHLIKNLKEHLNG